MKKYYIFISFSLFVNFCIIFNLQKEKISEKKYKNCLSKSYNYKNKNICVTNLIHKKEV